MAGARAQHHRGELGDVHGRVRPRRGRPRADELGQAGQRHRAHVLLPGEELRPGGGPRTARSTGPPTSSAARCPRSAEESSGWCGSTRGCSARRPRSWARGGAVGDTGSEAGQQPFTAAVPPHLRSVGRRRSPQQLGARLYLPASDKAETPSRGASQASARTRRAPFQSKPAAAATARSWPGTMERCLAGTTPAGLHPYQESPSPYRAGTSLRVSYGPCPLLVGRGDKLEWPGPHMATPFELALGITSVSALVKRHLNRRRS